MNIAIGLTLSIITAYAAFKKGSLNKSGFAAATLLGTSLYIFGGLYFWVLMISFFISSSLLTKFKGGEKEALEEVKEKEEGRNYVQVAANGGLGFIYGLLYFISDNPVFVVAYAVAFAAANADTWSSELGVLSKRPPVLILNFKRTERGESGAVSLMGTAAAFLGAFFIAIVFAVGYTAAFGWSSNLISYSFLVLLLGFSGSIIDSLLGAAIQVKYRCSSCGKITEKQIHHGERATQIKGLRFINNDAVNFISGVIVTVLVLFIA